jgi:hypothetical protein
MKTDLETGEPAAPSEAGFAPKDLTDGKGAGEWDSRYGAAPWRAIIIEGAYLSLLLLVVVAGMVVVWLRQPGAWWHLSPMQSATFTRYAYAWLAGTLGGVLFAMKWLYHSVAKGTWHIDRAPWRYLTPHISGGLAFSTVAILNSLLATDAGAAMSGTKVVAIGFLVGFFSDNALAKLAEVAETLLGPTRRFDASKDKNSDEKPSRY